MVTTKRIARAVLVISTVLFLLFSETAYGLSDACAIDSDNEVNITEQASHDGTNQVIEPNGNVERQEAKETGDARTSDIQEVPSVKEYIKTIPNDLVGGTKRIFHSDNLPLVLIGSGLTLSALAIDGKAKKETLEDHPLGNTRNFGNTVGAGYIEIAAGVGVFLSGQVFNDKKIADTGIGTLEALLMDGIANEVLKYAVGRQRPNGQGDKMSFPSGHASITATFAASVSEMYDWDLRLAIPLYATVAVVGVARMDSNMHYLSDVLAGITLGTLIGSSFAKYHKEKTAEHRISFLPMYEQGFKGVLFSYHF